MGNLLELSNRFWVPKQGSRCTCSDLCSIHYIACNQKAIELINKHVVNSRQLVAGSQPESQLHHVGDVPAGAHDVAHQLLLHHINPVDSAVLPDHIVASSLAVLGSHEDVLVAYLLLVDQISSAQLIDREERELRNHKEEAVFRAHVHENREVVRKIGVVLDLEEFLELSLRIRRRVAYFSDM